jgi:hypothetical protein
VSVYEKLTSVRVPARMTGVQFGFGHTCPTEAGFTDSVNTRSLPFFEEVSVSESDAEKLVVWDSIGLFGFVPGLKQSTVAV